jgi:hypothetical protein
MKNKDYYVEGVKQVPISYQVGLIIGVLVTLFIFYILN